MLELAYAEEAGILVKFTVGLGHTVM